MCTVTVFPFHGGVRIGCNRDESPKRKKALPPSIQIIENTSVLMPIDPQSGGTWLAANEHGIFLTLLNRNLILSDGENRFVGNKSRGHIIPMFVGMDSAEDIAKKISDHSWNEYSFFRLIVLDQKNVYEIIHENIDQNPILRKHPRDTWPMIFSSSGLGDPIVEEPRRKLFDEWFSNIDLTDDQLAEKHDKFHCHSWEDKKHVSVCMQRDRAESISMTMTTIVSGQIHMSYRQGLPSLNTTPLESTLPVQSISG